MNYRHSYHAGNFCDVMKHVTLTALLDALMQKDKPLCYIDTHAGAGQYDLFCESAEKTQEYKLGIAKIMLQTAVPPLIERYLACVHALNHPFGKEKTATLRYYPGSPLFAKQLLRPQDRLCLAELHPEEAQKLKTLFLHDKQVGVHHTDGFLGLKAFLPPAERRGLVLIDPPYENSNELDHLIKVLPTALKRFETGTYAIWYPIKQKRQLAAFYAGLQKISNKPLCISELMLYPELQDHLSGCGMAIINPPWQFEKTLSVLLPWLWKVLTINDQGHYSTQLYK